MHLKGKIRDWLDNFLDRASNDYFRSTNHKGVAALNELFLKKNWIQICTFFPQF